MNGPGASAPVAAHAGRWSVETEGSKATFAVRDKLVTTVHGTMPVLGGSATVGQAGEIVDAWVELSVAGIETGNAHRDRDLLKARFLDADGHPSIRVRIGPTADTSQGWEAHAVVSARGAEAPLDCHAVLTPEGASPARVRVTGRLDRTPLGIKAPSFIIGRWVDIDADLAFRRQE